MLHASVPPRFGRLLILHAILLSVASHTLAQQAQQPWPPQYTNTPITTPAPAQPNFQGQLQPQPQRQPQHVAQQTFAAPPQRVANPPSSLVTLTPAAPNNSTAAPANVQVQGEMAFDNLRNSAETFANAASPADESHTFAAEPSPTESVTKPSEAEPAAEPGDAETTDQADLADKLGKGAEKAKTTLSAALMENNRQAQWSLARDYLLPVIAIVLVMTIAVWIGNRLRERVSKFVSRRVDVTLGRFAGTLTKVSIVVGSFLSVLTWFGFEMTSLAALIAAIGFAVGMALQGTLGNFASGIALLVFRPFNVGDFIAVDGTSGSVQAIELFTTTIDTPDNRRVIVPNESVFGHKIENWTHNKQRRVEVKVGVSYTADMKHTRRVLTDALASVEGALPEPAPAVYLCELNASSVDWSCRVWCHTADFLKVKERVTESVKESLDRNGIGIPFPQLDLHVIAPPKQQRSAAA